MPNLLGLCLFHSLSRHAYCAIANSLLFNPFALSVAAYSSYPSLNRSRCCMKSICTECFLQMKNPNSTRPTQCENKEEKGIEQIEEQRVIEAQIRMRQQELQDNEERMNKRQELGSSSTAVAAGDVQYNSVGV
ncbi:hypothetical protein F3Y22_tig00111540pilonHSYRG00207 [Hibiscus syriacus]|uniref:Uncharacterized protein n=1 Tax=Hibiscus syriacus TaxID=106335 RepID=A0A6A2XNZ5_HIBSY|nr:hypothetical protein F3Y22_tig00111540pilonHSYRG00207 [Hibiscus syriacus]